MALMISASRANISWPVHITEKNNCPEIGSSTSFIFGRPKSDNKSPLPLTDPTTKLALFGKLFQYCINRSLTRGIHMSQWEGYDGEPIIILVRYSCVGRLRGCYFSVSFVPCYGYWLRPLSQRSRSIDTIFGFSRCGFPRIVTLTYIFPVLWVVRFGDIITAEAPLLLCV